LASALSVIVLGDESGYTVGEAQKTKMAAIEAMWETEPAPAPFTLVALPNEAQARNDWAVQIPWVMGLIGTRSVSEEIPGIVQIKEKNRARILSGIAAVGALEALQKDPHDRAAKEEFERRKADLGFGLLLKRYVAHVQDATPQQIQSAVDSTVPRVAPMFWSFRLMVGLAMLMLALFALSFLATLKAGCMAKRWLLRWALWMLPVPWIACELGWFVAEYGRQPWTIYGVLPTSLSVSSLSVSSLYGSLAGFIGFYTCLLVVEMFLMVKFARLGPGSLGTGRYFNEPGDHGDAGSMAPQH
jgi:cytochrome d ubiquinol oxidase subunit I